MKKLMLTATVLLSMSAQAAPNCLGEAQIIAKVGSIKSKTATVCVANVDPSSIVQFNMSYVCPLLLEDVMSQGVDVGLTQNKDCSLKTGDILTGVIYMKNDGTLALE